MSKSDSASIKQQEFSSFASATAPAGGGGGDSATSSTISSARAPAGPGSITSSSDDHELSVAIDTPYFNPTLDPKVVSTMVAGAVAYAPLGFHVTIPSTLVPGLEQYVSNQLQLVVTNGRVALVASLGESQQIYSLSQLQIDAAIVGAIRALH